MRILYALAVLATAIALVQAQAGVLDDQQHPCSNDARDMCSSIMFSAPVEERGALVGACLRRNVRRLSAGCRSRLQTMLMLTPDHVASVYEGTRTRLNAVCAYRPEPHRRHRGRHGRRSLVKRIGHKVRAALMSKRHKKDRRPHPHPRPPRPDHRPVAHAADYFPASCGATVQAECGIQQANGANEVSDGRPHPHGRPCLPTRNVVSCLNSLAERYFDPATDPSVANSLTSRLSGACMRDYAFSPLFACKDDINTLCADPAPVPAPEPAPAPTNAAMATSPVLLRSPTWEEVNGNARGRRHGRRPRSPTECAAKDDFAPVLQCLVSRQTEASQQCQQALGSLKEASDIVLALARSALKRASGKKTQDGSESPKQCIARLFPEVSPNEPVVPHAHAEAEAAATLRPHVEPLIGGTHDALRMRGRRNSNMINNAPHSEGSAPSAAPQAGSANYGRILSYGLRLGLNSEAFAGPSLDAQTPEAERANALRVVLSVDPRVYDDEQAYRVMRRAQVQASESVSQKLAAIEKDATEHNDDGGSGGDDRRSKRRRFWRSAGGVMTIVGSSLFFLLSMFCCYCCVKRRRRRQAEAAAAAASASVFAGSDAPVQVVASVSAGGAPGGPAFKPGSEPVQPGYPAAASRQAVFHNLQPVAVAAVYPANVVQVVGSAVPAVAMQAPPVVVASHSSINGSAPNNGRYQRFQDDGPAIGHVSYL